MDTVKKLTSIEPPYMHLFIGTAKKVHELLSLLNESTGSIAKVINGSHGATVNDFFDECAAVLNLPSYFGHTWDSFDECINDLSWLSADSYILIIQNFNEALKNEDTDKKILIDILVKSAIAWASGRKEGALVREPTPFHVVLHCTEHEKEVLRLLKQSNLTEAKK